MARGRRDHRDGLAAGRERTCVKHGVELTAEHVNHLWLIRLITRHGRFPPAQAPGCRPISAAFRKESDRPPTARRSMLQLSGRRDRQGDGVPAAACDTEWAGSYGAPSGATRYAARE